MIQALAIVLCFTLLVALALLAISGAKPAHRLIRWLSCRRALFQLVEKAACALVAAWVKSKL
ncbi:hypothetical protein WMF30_10220 [Sorangium sp. So ce134]